MPISSYDATYEQAVEFVAGILCFSQRSADLAIAYLDKLGLREEALRLGIPSEFAHEAGAIAQISRWEEAGLAGQLPSDLPSAAAAEKSLWERINASPGGYLAGNSGTELANKVLHVWMRHFAPAGLAELAEDILLVGRCDDDPLESIAEFLWQYQHLINEKSE